MAALGESITVVNKSGKIVSTSKHIVNVFKEARSAYLEKKAELKAEREGNLQSKATRQTNGSGRRSPGSEKHSSSRRHDHRRSYSRDTSPSRYSSSSRRRDSGHRDSRRRDSGHRDSGHRDSRHRDSRHHDSSRSGNGNSSSRRHGDGTHERPSPSRMHTQPISPSHLRNAHGPEDDGSSSESLRLQQQLTRRRHSDSETLPRHPSAAGVPSDEEIDMGLAYGEELPPPLPARRQTTRGVEEELHSKMSALTRLLEEANCMQHSARAVVKNLEENPDAMAAVALTLAEISNLAARMAPGALTSFKSTFPVVMGLLASPEFLIAGGVAIGVTVVMFGGYKIIKRIKANKLLEKEGEAEELEEITSDLDSIETWRRGIMPLEEGDSMSVATSVEGEFITPRASTLLREEGVLGEKKDRGSSSKKDKSDRKAAEKEEKKKEKKEKSDREKQEKRDKKDRDKDKEPSGLLMLFKKDRDHSAT